MTQPIAPSSLRQSQPVQKAQVDPALHKVAQQFEAVFLRQVIGEMRKGQLAEDMLGSNATNQFRELADARTADDLAAKGQFGISALIERQLAGVTAPAAGPVKGAK